jgi:hypothetical protein
MSISRFRIAPVLVLLLVMVLPLLRSGDSRAEDGNRTPKVLIAYQESDFKTAVVEGLESALQERAVYCEKASVSALRRVDDSEWDAIVIVQTVKMGSANGKVKKYLDGTSDLDKVVLVTTAGSGDWSADEWGIDCITSASKMEEMGDITAYVLQRLDTIR